MKHPWLIGLLIGSLLAFAGTVQAGTVHFIGGHPISPKQGGGYCYIDAPHLHVYGPDRPQLYQRVGDEYVFAADPTPFGYDGEKHPYYGHHPIVTIGTEPVFCYLDGPHFHPFEAPDVPDYKTRSGVAFYVGAYPPGYVKLRPGRRRAVNAEYRAYVGMRPSVEVQPPEGWQGEVWVAPPAVEVVAPSVHVSAPGVIVAPPSVQVSAPGVVVQAPGVFVAPPRVVFAPPPRVVVQAPSFHVGAPSVVVSSPGVYMGGPVVVGGKHRGGHGGHGDRGRHRGWDKD